MFTNQKYITNGIDDRLEPILQLFLWDAVTQAGKKVKLDYLQVFQLSPAVKDGITMQQVIHTQEHPPYKNELFIICGEPITAKIFCIDDGDHSTMLFAEEY